MEENLEHKKFTLTIRCPHCDELCFAPLHIHTDDENVLSAFELLSNFEIKGKEKEDE